MNKGFTLIELLVVVLIIGILAAIALPQYTRAVERSRAAEAWTAMGTLLTAERIYQLTEGAYTTEAANLDIEFPLDGGVVKTNSFDITLADGTDGGIEVIATRRGGAYNGQGFKNSMDKRGAILGPEAKDTASQDAYNTIWSRGISQTSAPAAAAATPAAGS